MVWWLIGCVQPPSPCLDPETQAREALGPLVETLRQEQTPDLDGDGVADWIFADSGSCGSGGCSWLIYASGEGCAHPVGWAGGRSLIATDTQTNGWLDVRIQSHAGYCPYNDYWLRFDGQAYEIARHRACECDPMTPSGIRCDDWAPAGPGD